MGVRKIAATLALTGGMLVALAAPALAWTNDTTAKGSAACASPKDGTATVTWTFSVHTPSGYHGRTVVTQSNDAAIPVGKVLTDGGTIPETRATSALPFTLALKVNYPDSGGDTTQYTVPATSGGTLTAAAPAGCTPVSHAPTLTGSVTCDTQTGQYEVTYAGDTDGGTVTPSLPVARTLAGTSTSDSQTATFSYTDGPDVTRTAHMEMSGDCSVPMALDPTASITRPTCVSRFFRVTLNNTASTGAVTFRITRKNDSTLIINVAAGQKTVSIFRAHSKERVSVLALRTLRAGPVSARTFSTCSTPPPTTHAGTGP